MADISMTLGDRDLQINTLATNTMLKVEEQPKWSVLANLPVRLISGIPIIRFTVRDLLRLTEGQIFASILSNTEDVPLNIGKIKMGWTEFEVVERKITLRVTRLS
jgi:flagellar motor switch protein FliN/FliY